MARAFRILTLALAAPLAAPAAALAVTGPAAQHLPDARVGEASAIALTYTTARPPADPGEAVSGVTVAGPDAARFAIADDRCTPHRVTASCTVVVRFSPAAAGPASAALTVQGEDAAATTALDAQGYVTGAVLQADPPAVDFGAGPAGAVSGPVTVAVRNGGDRAVTLASVDLTGPGAASFSVDADACVRAVLGPAGSCGVDVRATVPASGEALAVLEVTGDDGSTARVALRVAAAGPSAPPPSGTVSARPGTSFVAVACELGILDVSGTRRRIRIRIYASCGQVVRFALYRGARRVRAFTRHVPPRTVSVTLRGRFARGGYAIRVAGGARGRRLGDGQSFVVRR